MKMKLENKIKIILIGIGILVILVSGCFEEKKEPNQTNNQTQNGNQTKITEEQAIAIANATGEVQEFLKLYPDAELKTLQSCCASGKVLRSDMMCKCAANSKSDWLIEYLVGEKEEYYASVRIAVDEYSGEITAKYPKLEYLNNVNYCEADEDCKCAGSCAGCANFIYYLLQKELDTRADCRDSKCIPDMDECRCINKVCTAIETKNPAIKNCEKIEDEKERDKCFHELAIKTGDLSICEKIGMGCIECAFYSVPNCIYAVTMSLHDPDLCEKSYGKDSCLKEAARAKNDSAICERITYEEFKNHCLAVVKQDDSYCENITNDGNKDWCLSEVANEKQDPLICEKMIDDSSKNLCLAKVKVDESFCKKTRWESECIEWVKELKKGSAINMSNIIHANNQFAIDLYSEFKNNEGNIFFSPYSISTALAMTYEGARGKTAEEMRSVLHLPENDTARRTGFAGIIEQINRDNKNYELRTANALWAQKDYKFLDEYFALVEKYYGGKVTNLDFAGETENSRITINNWVENQTNNKIKDLIPQGVLNDMTRLVLTNAIYFKGKWAKQFDKENTREADFKVTSGKTVKVRMMSLTGEEAKFNYAETSELQILELPYDGGELSMLILLPKEDNLQTIEEWLIGENLTGWKNNLMEQEVNVYLPKFTFESKYFMKETLEEMGMPTAFSRDADFSGMDGSDQLYLSSVIHQAFVEVNEEGTEAAAATAVVITEKGMPTTFRADHPFIFIIQEKETGNILFLGRVADPGKN